MTKTKKVKEEKIKTDPLTFSGSAAAALRVRSEDSLERKCCLRSARPTCEDDSSHTEHVSPARNKHVNRSASRADLDELFQTLVTLQLHAHVSDVCTSSRSASNCRFAAQEPDFCGFFQYKYGYLFNPYHYL